MINKISKRMCILRKNIDSSIQYDVLDGLNLLKKMTQVKFIESVDVAINLNIDARKSDQNVRGYVIMPHGIGRDVCIAVFTQGVNVRVARDAGADIVGLDDIFDIIKQEKYKLDVVIASPDVMHIVSKLGPILGPKGLMPNPKMGTVSHDIEESVKNAKLGQVRYRNDKNGIIHALIGKINFDAIKLRENLEALILSVRQVKPIQCKGIYIKKIILSTTMGRSVLINQNSLCVIND